MLKNVLNGTVNWQTRKVKQLCRVSHPCLDDHQFKQEELESIGELSEVRSQMFLKCLYLARVGRPDIFWSMNMCLGLSPFGQTHSSERARLDCCADFLQRMWWTLRVLMTVQRARTKHVGTDDKEH